MEPAIEGEPTVLIVEDEPDLADMFYNWLKDDYQVEAYISGRDAIERLRPDIDVALLDRRLPDVSGDEILEEIRNMRLPAYVVMVTAIEPDRSILELEFDDYLVKPVTREDIEGAVDRMLTRQHHDDKLRELFQVVSKMATLEAKMELEELQDSDLYHQLEGRYELLWEDIDQDEINDDVYREGTLEKLQALLARMDRAHSNG